MNLEQLTLEIRPRSPWEAMDLAVRLCVQNWRILLSSWLVTVLPVFLLVSIILLPDHPYWAFLLVWFLKPLYDRVPLWVLSRLIFSEQPGWQDVLRAVPGFFKTGLLSALTLYRLDMGRAFALPTVQLEGLRGKQRTRRMRALRRGAKNREVILFILCFHLESLLSWGLIGLLLILLPTDMALKGAEVVLVNNEPPLWVNALTMSMYFIAMMVIEILYVAGGFMLYLNRRTILEGWDIELTFRKLQQKYAADNLLSGAEIPLATKVAAAIMLCFLLPLSIPEPVLAAEVPYDNLRHEIILPQVAAQKIDPQLSGQVIRQVMQEPVFNRYKTISYLKYTGTQEPAKKSGDSGHFIEALVQFFEAMGKILALFFETGLWILALFFIFLIIKYWSRLKIAFSGLKKSSQNEVPETLFGLDIREQSLPDDVRAEALKLIDRHDYRAALALLYRACLAYLVKHDILDLKPGATEGDCVKAVRQHLNSQQDIAYFIELTQAWQLTAYAHRELPESQLKALLSSGTVFYERQTENSSDKTQNNDHG